MTRQDIILGASLFAGSLATTELRFGRFLRFRSQDLQAFIEHHSTAS